MNHQTYDSGRGHNGAIDTSLSQALLPVYDVISREITQRKHETFQELISKQSIEWSKLLEYTHYDLSSLANAIASSSPQVFKEHVNWVAALFATNGIPLGVLKKNIEIMGDVLRAVLPGEHQAQVVRYLTAGVSEIEHPPTPRPTHIDPSSPHATLAEKYLASLLAAERDKASRLVLDSFNKGVGIRDIYLQVLQPVQYEIGRLWHLGEISVAQEHFASSVTQLIMAQLYPFISPRGREKGKGVVVAVCVSGELHEIGIRMVADFFEMEGWFSHFLGANMPTHDIVQALETHKADLLAVSASMSSNVLKAKNIITAVRSSRARGTRVMVGGYVFNSVPGLWRRVGADYYAESAESALRLSRDILMKRSRDGVSEEIPKAQW